MGKVRGTDMAQGWFPSALNCDVIETHVRHVLHLFFFGGSKEVKVYSPARTPYEEFWNSEHLHVFQMFCTGPLKDRAQIVEQRWNLKQKVLHMWRKFCKTMLILMSLISFVLHV